MCQLCNVINVASQRSYRRGSGPSLSSWGKLDVQAKANQPSTLNLSKAIEISEDDANESDGHYPTRGPGRI